MLAYILHPYHPKKGADKEFVKALKNINQQLYNDVFTLANSRSAAFNTTTF